jgi:hypothetical protein
MKETYFNEKLEKVSLKRVYPFCNLQSWVRAHAVLMMGLYELY